ncbi:hypothetical protein BGLA2_940017 [Burkholderia gladioli]|nr:hypothetical protein BGLA2_940017 [Burkholderia gladioli]
MSNVFDNSRLCPIVNNDKNRQIRQCRIHNPKQPEINLDYPIRRLSITTYQAFSVIEIQQQDFDNHPANR